MRDIVILEGRIDGPSRLTECRALASLHDVLPNDEVSGEWRAVLNAFHRAGLQGEGQTIAVIDTGYDPKTPLLEPGILRDRSIDLTEEGIDDVHGHGTSVSLILRACAPEAKIIHVKAFGKAGRCHGASGQMPDAVFEQALVEARDRGANIINISAGLNRSTRDKVDYGHNAAICICPICTTAKKIVLDTGISIFAASGNDGRSTRTGGDDWWCPSNAPCVVPVVGYADGKPIYDPWHAHPVGVVASGVVHPAARKRQWIPAWMRRMLDYFTDPAVWHGSSMATPMIAGTAALVRQAFALLGEENPNAHSKRSPKEAITFFECNGIRGELEISYRFKLHDFFRTFSAEPNPNAGLTNIAFLGGQAARLMKGGQFENAATIFRLLINLQRVYPQFINDAWLFSYLWHLGRCYVTANPLQAMPVWSNAIALAARYPDDADMTARSKELSAEIAHAQNSNPMLQLWSEPIDIDW